MLPRPVPWRFVAEAGPPDDRWARGSTLRSVNEQRAPEAERIDDPPAPFRRPATVSSAAALTGVVGALLFSYGVYLAIAGVAGRPVLRGRAELAGVLFAAFGLGIAWVARGLLRTEPWARTPALLTHLLVIGSSYWIFQQAVYAAAVPVGLFGLAGVVLLFVPTSHQVLSRDMR
jgi:hypothetical protein